MRCQQPQLESTNLHVVHFPARLPSPGGKQCLSCCSAHAITGTGSGPVCSSTLPLSSSL